MNINTTAFIGVEELSQNISSLLWDKDIQHQSYCVEQDGEFSHIEIDYDIEVAKVLHEYGWITTDQWNEMLDSKVDYITIF
jgi:very-short-patch-repair endonuclease